MVLSSATSICAAQNVTVRVVDATNLRPLQKQQVTVSFLYDTNAPVPKSYDRILRLETDSSGEARFGLPAPAPEHISVVVGLTFENWRCGCGVLAATQDVIHVGVEGALPGREQKTPALPTKAPGQILILARPLTFFERLLYPLLKG